ncbi:hypothetical protein OG828_34335 [Streptomyces sp. NBC_00457]|uniref:hypothetical protein n=1 Tax=unclassified Streptomyces TaxID=2593676 RepID=UPI002E23C5D4|nr:MULTISPECIES: hypothetical protein [unclassified Streptomyces]
MSQPQYPQQQPGWGGPQQPGYGPPPFQPLPPKKSNAGKIVGFGCLGLVGLFVLIAIVGAIAGSGSETSSSGATDVNPAASAPKEQQPAVDDTPTSEDKPSDEATKKEKPKKKVVTFKVWGTAPAGALGPLDITYGSDSDNREGKWENGKFTATLPLDDDAMYYTLLAQLQGSGDINCSVTVDGHTEKAHASGGYNICHAQANAGLLGGWG